MGMGMPTDRSWKLPAARRRSQGTFRVCSVPSHSCREYHQRRRRGPLADQCMSRPLIERPPLCQ